MGTLVSIINLIAAVALVVLPVSRPCSCQALTLFCGCDDAVATTEGEQASAEAASVEHAGHCCGCSHEQDASSAQSDGDDTQASRDGAGDCDDPTCPSKRKDTRPQWSVDQAASKVAPSQHLASAALASRIPLPAPAADGNAPASGLPVAAVCSAHPPPVGLLVARTQRLLI